MWEMGRQEGSSSCKSLQIFLPAGCPASMEPQGREQPSWRDETGPPD